jgi:hypothetical protein
LSYVFCEFSPDTKPTTGFKAPQGQGCPRCGFAVYAAEQMISKNRVSVVLHINVMHVLFANHALHSVKMNKAGTWIH